MNLIAFLGIQKDSRGLDQRRWERFRPSIAICMHEDLDIENYYLIHNSKHSKLLQGVTKDIKKVSPDTNVIPVEMDFNDAFEPLEAFERQMDFVNSLDATQEYLISLTTGTHVNQYAWFKLVENNFINAKLVQVYGYPKEKSNPDERSVDELARGRYRIIDLNLAKYDRFHEITWQQKASVEEFLKRGIQTKSESYNETISLMEKVAVRNNHPILIDGPTGAGKTHLVSQLYNLKKEKGVISGEFHAINCATLQPESAISVLFGHKKGAYTGASSDRDGLIKKADKGILFLDEIAELSLKVQGMLLTALETKTYRPMGSDTIEHSDFVLISGTNVDLEAAVERGEFRDDLLGRINLWHFTLPGLKDRLEDIEVNLEYELLKYEKSEGSKVRFNTEAKCLYLQFATSSQALWRRNFRDLTASVTRMATLAENGVISQDLVEMETERLKKSWSRSSGNNELSSIDLVDIVGEKAQEISYIDAQVLKETIRVCKSSKSAVEAARKLYNTENGTELSQNPQGRLNNYLKKYGLSFKTL